MLATITGAAMKAPNTGTLKGSLKACTAACGRPTGCWGWWGYLGADDASYATRSWSAS